MQGTAPKVHYLKDYCPPEFKMHTVHLHIDLHEDRACVQAVLDVERVGAPDAPLVLNGEKMTLTRVSIDGRPLAEDEYTVTPTDLTIHSVPDRFKCETEVVIKPQENTELAGLYQSRGNFCTQCEAHGFRRITYYFDRPDVMSQFTTTITADKARYPFLLSNGNLIEQRDLPGGRHWVRWEDPSRKPAYLFALVAGDFDVLTDTFTTCSGREVALHLYLEKGYADQGDYALTALKEAMAWDETRWGREYDLDIYMIVAVSDFNMGAMENKGLNIFNTKYILAKPETATDMDYVNIQGVIGHEYFHNWSGNRVTCRDWFQITLKEGLTVFRDQHFTEDMTSEAVARIREVNVIRNVQFPEDAGPMAHPIRPESYMEVNNFYTPTVYRKGAEVIRMVQTLISKETFRKGLDLYFSRHDGQAVTTEDFIQAMADASGRDLGQFQRWYQQAGTPQLTVTSQYQPEKKTFTLTVKQTCPPTPGQTEKAPLHIPLSVGLVTDQCRDLALRLEGESKACAATTRVLEVTEPTQSFTFVDVPSKPIASLLRHFSAPVRLDYDYSNDDLAWLLQCDKDPFARWEAGQKLATRAIFALVSDIEAQKPLLLSPAYSWAMNTVLQHMPEDLAYASQLLGLPSLQYLMTQMEKVDMDALQQAHQFAMRSLAQVLEPQLLTLYEAHRSDGPYVFSVAHMGRRAFANQCLTYLLATEKAPYFDYAYEAFTRADNMTDAYGALFALNNHETPLRAKALAAFYDRWQKAPLVVNKWLTLQASATLPDTLKTVRSLMQHPAFDIKNPNNVYALICAFGANVASFHDASGDAYRWVADQVLHIQAANPQVAARVIQPLTYWQKMDVGRAEQMRAALEKIKAAPGLSPDIYEVVCKSL